MISAQKSREHQDPHVSQGDHAGASPSPSRPRSPQRWAPPVVALFALVALVVGVGLLALPVIVWLAARQVPASTTVRRLALAVLALFGVNAIVLTTAAGLDLTVDARVVAAAYLVVGALVAHRRHTSISNSIATASDWWALGTALTTFALFYRPFVGASPGRSMAQLSFSTDPGNHLSLVQQSLQQGGYVAASDYPPAWSGNVGLAIELIAGSAPSPTSLLTVAAPLIVGFYSLLVFFAVALTVDAVHAAVGEQSRWPAAVAATCIGLTTLIGSSHLLLSSGSYTQILAVTILLAIATLLGAADEQGWRLTVVLGLLSIALMQTWYLLAPVLGVLLLVHVAASRPSLPQVIVVSVPTALCSLYPLLKGPAPVSQLNAVGGTPFPHQSVLAVLLILTLGAIALLLRQKGSATQPAFVLALLVVVTLLTTLLVLVVQLVTSGGFGYYGAKMFYVVFLFGAIAVAAAGGVASERAFGLGVSSRSLGRPVSIVVVLLIVGGLAGVSVTMRDSSWTFAAGQPPAAVDGAVLDAILSAHSQGLPADTDAWVLDGCSRATDHIANKWTHDLFQTWTDSRRKTNNLYRARPAGDVSMLLDRADEAEVARMEVYVKDDCNPGALARLASNPKVAVIRVP